MGPGTEQTEAQEEPLLLPGHNSARASTSHVNSNLSLLSISIDRTCLVTSETGSLPLPASRHTVVRSV